MIKLSDVYYSYNFHDTSEITALAGINLEIPEGQFVSIIGHNGCGKSTLAKLLNGLLLPAKGEVLIDEKNTKNHKDLINIRQKVGMIFQNPDNQIVASVVEEDVAFGPENLGVEPDNIRLRVDEALKAVNLSDRKLSQTHLLSGGQKQLIAIAGALAIKPKYLVMDEPTTMLDPVGRKEVLSIIKELNKKIGLTIILITHIMDEAALSDRIIVMSEGKIVLDGHPKSVFVNVELLKKISLDVPLATSLAFDLKSEGMELPNSIITLDEFQVAMEDILLNKKVI